MKLATLIYGIVFGSLLINNVCAKTKKAKSVTTLLEAKWESSPLVLEVAEYLADENNEFYWKFVKSISNLQPSLAELSNDKEIYNKIIDHASKLLTETQLSVLKFGLALHVYSPKVQMFNQIATERQLPDCPIVAEVSGKLSCDLKEIKSLIENPTKKSASKIDLYRVDHHYPGSENHSLAVILYGQIGTKEFKDFHNLLETKAQEGKIDYVIRYYIKNKSDRKLRLSGYGVELQMKSTEYKAQDDTELKEEQNQEESSQEEEDIEIEGFDFSKLKKLFPDLKKDLVKFRQHLEESSNEMAALKVWQFQELSLQAAERIMNAPKDEALKVFTNIAQNFPIQARGLVKTVVNPDLKAEMKKNADVFASTLNLQPSDTALFINGMFYDIDIVDIYAILDVLRQELRSMEGLHAIGIGSKTMSSLLALDFSESSSSQEFAIDIRDSAINWINDIESDPRYIYWPSSLMELLRPSFPGMIRQVRKNLFNLVLLIDPVNSETHGVLKLVESFIVHVAPIRVGLVFKVDSSKTLTGLDDAGVAMLCAFNYLSQTKDAPTAFRFIRATMEVATGDVTVNDVKKQLKEYDADVDDILGEDSDYDFGRQLSEDFVQRTGLKKFPQALLNGIPLPESKITTEDLEEVLLQEVMSQTSFLQKSLYRGKLTDSENVLDFLMNQPYVMPRLNNRILNRQTSFYLDMSGEATSLTNLQTLLKLSPRDMTATAVENFKYFTVNRKGTKYHSITYWVVGDLHCQKSRQLLLEALEHMKSEPDVRVSFVPNVNGDKKNSLNKVVLAALQELQSEKATNFVISLLKDDEAIKLIEKESFSNVPEAVKSKVEAQELNLKMLRVYSQRVLNLKDGERAVVANGRVLGPFEENETFNSEDFALLMRFNTISFLEKVDKALKDKSDTDDEDLTSDTMLKMESLLVSKSQSKPRFEVGFAGDQHSVIKIPAAHPDQVAFDLIAVVDPVSRGAQKIGPILQVLQDVLNCNIKVFLNSVEKNSDMPLKSFYRFVVESEVQFSDDGKQLAGPIAKFNNMPSSPLLTQNYHVPDNWLVEVVRSVYDLDNIRLENVESNVHSEYELEYLLLEGHCFEQNTHSPPRGLQITLGTESRPVIVDTIVMANLGYFQLKANPGAWLLRLRQGRSADIYDIVSHEGTDSPDNSTDIKVLINSFRSHIVKLKVQKKLDKMNMDLLTDDNEPNNGIWNSITSSFAGNEEETEEKLNIFSVASGHLYERFLRIMMLSVLKNTKTPVKFWFLKNYLSPQLKDFLPYMSKEYGFEYELVQYKWPRWLHQQTEKQRIIWGYKILFLDVLFPLDVKKIIFVDADQVVRADLKELQQFDLGGAPYGYTPFCDSRKEMEGFRFWKQGYWKNHLQGRRYHISALYVVDLKRFRRIAAGDRLRGQYQALSQDPNSLSNLDQDLPNNMIHQVAIKSLPQEWLWCETWCDEGSKKYAKTIDLCNNPQTKEAKLTAAVRILPEWKGYDDTIRELQKKIDSGLLDTDPSESSSDNGSSSSKRDGTDIHSEL